MIPKELVESLNSVRGTFLESATLLPEVPSFVSLLNTSPRLRASLETLTEITRCPRLGRPCDGSVTVAMIGSSGHGKTTIMDEMFPRLAERGWLVTDVTDTTAQSLRIQYAPSGTPDLDEVVVHSWDVEQIKELMRHPEVAEQNRRDGIKVSYLEAGVDVDGSEAGFCAADLEQFRFPKRIELRPFAEPYQVPPEQAADRRFIRALTVKEQSQVLETGPVLSANGDAYDALQLRALVKDVSLKDSYERIVKWSRRPAEEVGQLTFVDTPGLAVNGSVKDEVLRHFLEKKSNQIALQLWKDDELDIVIHLVLCGRQSDFAVLWKAIERECGPAEMESLADRLIVAVNGMNIFFTNRDLKNKYEDPAAARREGDQLATTVEDNILQKMSPRGRVQPARLCFVDSRSIVETATAGSYERAYEQYRPVMEQWARPGGTGHETLRSLGLVESFRRNIEALADPEDRGQGFLVRQLLDLVEEQGPALLLRKYLLRTGLLQGITDLQECLATYYEADGSMNREAVRAALRSCLGFLDTGDLETIERFCAEVMDPRIEALELKPGADWVAAGFFEMCAALREGIAGHGRAPPAVAAQFERHYDAQTGAWADRWGYRGAQLAPPDKGFTNTADLVRHSLEIHAREILYQLLVEERLDEGEGGFEQSQKDQEQIQDVMRRLEAARRLANAALSEHGVEA